MDDAFERGAAAGRDATSSQDQRRQALLQKQASARVRSDTVLVPLAKRFEEKFILQKSAGRLRVQVGNYEGADYLEIDTQGEHTEFGFLRLGDGFDIIWISGTRGGFCHENAASNERMLEIAGEFFGTNESRLRSRSEKNSSAASESINNTNKNKDDVKKLFLGIGPINFLFFVLVAQPVGSMAIYFGAYFNCQVKGMSGFPDFFIALFLAVTGIIISVAGYVMILPMLVADLIFDLGIYGALPYPVC